MDGLIKMSDLPDQVVKWLSTHHATPTPITPPISLQEFESRLGKMLGDLLDRYYGIACYLSLDERSTVDKNPTYKNLVELGAKFGKKFAKKPCIITTHVEGYSFLKLALEKGFPFTEQQQDALGIKMNISELNLPQKREIAAQVSAQVYWFLEKSKIPSVEKMQERLLDKKCPIFDLIDLGKTAITNQLGKADSSTLRRCVAKVYPKVKGSGRGRPSIRDVNFDKIILIPDVFRAADSSVDFQRLYFVISCLTRVLLVLGFSAEQIKGSELIQVYRDLLQFYPRMYVGDWIDEANGKNCSIFDL